MAKKYEQKKKDLASRGMPDPVVKKNVTNADKRQEMGPGKFGKDFEKRRAMTGRKTTTEILDSHK